MNNINFKNCIKVSAVSSVLFLLFTNPSLTKTIEIKAKSLAQVSFIKGKLYSIEKNKKVSLSKGFKVNNHLKADKNSKAEIKFSDGSYLRLNEKTDIMLVSDSSNEKHGLFKLITGRLWANITPKYKNRFAVQSRTTSLAVLGTTFDMELEKDKTDITVFEDSVGIQSSNEDSLAFNKSLDTLNVKIDDYKDSAIIKKPDKIDKPKEMEKPYKLIEETHNVSKDEWLELVVNQKISVDNNGLRIVSELKPEEIKEDELISWNKSLDSNTSESILFNKKISRRKEFWNL